MNKDDVIRMAREAATDVNLTPSISLKYAERFAALVAAAEREKVAKWMMQRGYATGHGETIEDLLAELEWQIRESERKRILDMCKEGLWDSEGIKFHLAKRGQG